MVHCLIPLALIYCKVKHLLLSLWDLKSLKSITLISSSPNRWTNWPTKDKKNINLNWGNLFPCHKFNVCIFYFHYSSIFMSFFLCASLLMDAVILVYLFSNRFFLLIQLLLLAVNEEHDAKASPKFHQIWPFNFFIETWSQDKYSINLLTCTYFSFDYKKISSVVKSIQQQK